MSFLLKRAGSYIISLNKRHQHQHGRQPGSEKVVRNVTITMNLLIFTAAVMWKESWSVLWASNIQEQLYSVLVNSWTVGCVVFLVLSLVLWQTVTFSSWKMIFLIQTTSYVGSCGSCGSRGHAVRSNLNPEVNSSPWSNSVLAYTSSKVSKTQDYFLQVARQFWGT